MGAMRQQLPGNATETRRAYTCEMAQPQSAPLNGYRIAVTSARRAEELCALLSRHGAEIFSAPAISMADSRTRAEGRRPRSSSTHADAAASMAA